MENYKSFKFFLKCSDGSYVGAENPEYWYKFNEYGEVEKWVGVNDIVKEILNGAVKVDPPVFKSKESYPRIFKNKTILWIFSKPDKCIIINDSTVYKGSCDVNTLERLVKSAPQHKEIVGNEKEMIINMFNK